MQCFITYPPELLARLKKSSKHLKRQLSNEIQRLLDNDSDVRRLIGGRSEYEALKTDPMVRNMVVDKTLDFYNELVAEGREGDRGEP